jgi:hypothetical protein
MGRRSSSIEDKSLIKKKIQKMMMMMVEMEKR